MDDNILLAVIFLVFCYLVYKFRKQIFSDKILNIFDPDRELYNYEGRKKIDIDDRKKFKPLKKNIIHNEKNNSKKVLSDEDSQQLGSLISENN